jgi:hypothetical protein
MGSMPITLSRITSPRGIPMVKSVSSGVLVEADVHALLQRFVPGGELAGIPYLATTEPGTTISPKVRGLFGSQALNIDSPAVAVVVASTSLRLMITFMARVAGKLSARFAATPLKCFAEESVAVAWLEDQVSAKRASA